MTDTLAEAEVTTGRWRPFDVTSPIRARRSRARTAVSALRARPDRKTRYLGMTRRGTALRPGPATARDWRQREDLRDERIGEVFAATERAACLRAIQRFKIKDEDRRDLEVRRAKSDSPAAGHLS
jgi:hypothetical protein